MNENVRLYDTYRSDKDGKRYRIIEVGNDTVKMVKVNEIGDRKHAGGRPRILTIADLFKGYSRVNLPPVTVSKIEPQKPIEDKTEEVIVQTENEAQIEEQAVREASEPKPHTLEDTFEEFRKKNEEDIEILKAELKDRVQECVDLKKTISKMQQAHEAEVADYKDRIMELEILAKKKTEYADALDDDSVAFKEILSLAETIQLVSTSAAKLAKQIIAKTDGRI